jgi:hypothetical protein
MTLDTTVYIHNQIDAHAVFAKCRELIGATGRHTFTDKPGWANDGTRFLGNDLGQGLPALLSIGYRPGGPLCTPEQSAEHDEDCNLSGGDYYDPAEPLCSGTHPRRPACWLEVSFDTAYGYRDAHGRGCGDLHAALVARLGQWLDEQSVRWSWQNEFTGEVHDGDGRYERLIDLCTSGFEATAWFRTVVLPAIAAELADSADPKAGSADV